ncbi:hypothetical protein RM550_26105 [Streptomyces sp. DSM 41527]|uniref:Uncharacterized protein n=1 Tax=Streptomyces mooreae TaxID=3075523 RepID=A0ABU2TDX4_9ACTN|nr:hypothetical protein [Streptomyces sp. DSM 41527]MDT0459148.1 hypothetical protein [Streptomyces sp. DSM 41527]
MNVKLVPWLLAYLMLSLPVVAHWYAARACHLSRRTRARILAALGRRLKSLLSEQPGNDDDDDPPVSLRPLP